MEMIHSLCMPAPKGSGIQYSFCGYITVPIKSEYDYTKIGIGGYSNSTFDDLNSNKYYDVVHIRRITPNILRLRNHLWCMETTNYADGVRMRDAMLERGILKEDVQFNYSGVPLDELNDAIEEKLNAGTDLKKVFDDIENKYPALMYAIRYNMRY